VSTREVFAITRDINVAQSTGIRQCCEMEL